MKESLLKSMIENRRYLHQHPELGWQEYETTAFIAQRLENLGYEIYMGTDLCDSKSRMDVPPLDVLKEKERCAMAHGVPEKYMEKMKDGHTGVLGILHGKKKGKTYALRFDMDGLPISEADTSVNKTYRSVNEGVMHGCGHDGHMAAGLGVAEILSKYKDWLAGDVRLIFQPAEEGCKGAASITAKGWLSDVDVFYSGHIGIGCRKLGQIFGCTQGFYATTKMNVYFHGVAAHAANAPEQGRNALLAAADYTLSAYRYYEAHKKDTRMNVGRLQSGTGRNIIADEAYLEVETRGFTMEANESLKAFMIKLATDMEKKYGVTSEIHMVGDAPTGKSDQRGIEMGKAAALEMGCAIEYGSEGIFSASEDVVHMMNEVQNHGGTAAYFMFGTTLLAEHHQKNFDFDASVLSIMTEFYVRLLLKNME